MHGWTDSHILAKEVLVHVSIDVGRGHKESRSGEEICVKGRTGGDVASHQGPLFARNPLPSFNMDYRASVRRAEERQPELPLSLPLRSPSSATAVTASSQRCLIKREKERKVGGWRERNRVACQACGKANIG